MELIETQTMELGMELYTLRTHIARDTRKTEQRVLSHEAIKKLASQANVVANVSYDNWIIASANVANDFSVYCT